VRTPGGIPPWPPGVRSSGECQTGRVSVTSDRTCSARGCRAPAGWALRWNNPRLHPPHRRKTWLACDDHRESLGAFLQLRGFLRETSPADALPADSQPADAPPADDGPEGPA